MVNMVPMTAFASTILKTGLFQIGNKLLNFWRHLFVQCF